METPKRKLKHKWRKRFELDSSATGDNYSVCTRCGLILADKVDKNGKCSGDATKAKKRKA